MTNWEKEFDSRFNNIWTDSWNAKLGCPDIKSINMRLKQFIKDLLKEEREKAIGECLQETKNEDYLGRGKVNAQNLIDRLKKLQGKK